MKVHELGDDREMEDNSFPNIERIFSNFSSRRKARVATLGANPGSNLLVTLKEVVLQKRVAIFFALLMMTAAGFGQIPSVGNVFLGYSYNRADTGFDNRGNLNGWEGSVEGKFLPFVGIVADVSGQYGNLPDPFTGVNAPTRVQSYLVGPRVSATVGRIRPFAHVLIGASHLHESEFGFSHSETDFADAIGGGIDYHLIPRVSWRVQLDDLQTRFNGGRQDDARFSTGLVLKF